jgi:hypothetical protein
MQDSELKMRPQICQDWEAESALIKRPVSLRANEIKFAVLALVSPWLFMVRTTKGQCHATASAPDHEQKCVCTENPSHYLSLYVAQLPLSSKPK